MHGVVLLAAGSGKRMGGGISDKILADIGSSNAFRMCMHAFANFDDINSMVIVFRDQKQKTKLQSELKKITPLNQDIFFSFVKGGKERSDSVKNGLNALPKSCKFAHIHDCARPMIRRETISLLIKNVRQSKATALARPVTNTIRKKLSNEEFSQTETPTRIDLWEMETPQSAPTKWFIEGYAKADKMNIPITDDMHAIELISKKIVLLDPGYPNPKITHLHDLKLISCLI